MKTFVTLSAFALLLAGCAIHDEREIAAVRAAGVSNRVVYKLQEGKILSPEDLVHLRRHRISDEIALRHLDEVGVNYVVQKSDVRKLRAANVSGDVIQELVRKSRDFADDYNRSEVYVGSVFYDDYWDYPYYGSVGWGYGYGHPGYYGRGYSHGHRYHGNRDHGHRFHHGHWRRR